MKAHTRVDDESGLVHHVERTAANAGNETQGHKLLHGKEGTVCGDSGYTGADKREELRGVKSVFLIAEKPSNLRAMKDEWDRRYAERWEHFRVSLGAKVKDPFRVIKRQLGFTKVSTAGWPRTRRRCKRCSRCLNCGWFAGSYTGCGIIASVRQESSPKCAVFGANARNQNPNVALRPEVSALERVVQIFPNGYTGSSYTMGQRAWLLFVHLRLMGQYARSDDGWAAVSCNLYGAGRYGSAHRSGSIRIQRCIRSDSSCSFLLRHVRPAGALRWTTCFCTSCTRRSLRRGA